MRALCGSEEHTSELQSPCNLVCRLLLEKKNQQIGGGRLDRLLRALRRPGRHSQKEHEQGLQPVHHQPPSKNRSTPLFFFNDTATTEIYTLSLHDAVPT